MKRMCNIFIFDICLSYTLKKITFLNHKFVIVMVISQIYIYSPAPDIGPLDYCVYTIVKKTFMTISTLIFLA